MRWLIAALLASDANRFGRVGARVLPVDHPRFADVLQVVLQAAKPPAYLMLPKPRGVADVERAAAAIERNRRQLRSRCTRWSRRTVRCTRCMRSPRTRASSRCRSG